jgi:hypothetical protein
VDLNSALFHDGHVPWFLLPAFSGITLENDIYARPNVYDPSRAAGLAFLGHELVHVGQFRNGMTRLGYLRMTRKDYRNSVPETPAYALQAKIQADLTNANFAGCPK